MSFPVDMGEGLRPGIQVDPGARALPRSRRGPPTQAARRQLLGVMVGNLSFPVVFSPKSGLEYWAET